MGNVSLAGWGTGPWWGGGWACGGKGNGRRRGVHTWMSNGADCRNRTCFLWGSGGAHECCSCSSLFFRRASRRPQLLLCTPSKRTKSVSSYNTMYPHSKTRICRPHNQKYRRAVTISSWEHRPRYLRVDNQIPGSRGARGAERVRDDEQANTTSSSESTQSRPKAPLSRVNGMF